MMDILDKFIEQAKENVKSGYYNIPKAVQNIRKISLRQKLQSQHFTLVAEIKHASPAGEYSFDGIDVNKLAFKFKNAGADAISVVVEPKIFKGDLGNISIAKKTGLPVIFKDFVISEEQIRSAAALGADCILLIVKVGERLNLDIGKLIKTAHSYGMETLLECYDNEEAQKALMTETDILGINNRDLKTLKVDLNRTRDIMEYLKTQNLKCHVISESGIKSGKDAEFVRALGVNGILVGTAIWTADDQYGKIKELRLRE